jgi:hypothetical protein
MDRIQQLMKSLDLTEAEAREMLEADAEIDKGADLFPLTAEQEKASKQARATGTRKTEYQFSKRERKPDNDKRDLISLLWTCLFEKVDIYATVTNPERQIEFTHNGRNFRLVLSAPRAPK